MRRVHLLYKEVKNIMKKDKKAGMFGGLLLGAIVVVAVLGFAGVIDLPGFAIGDDGEGTGLEGDAPVSYERPGVGKSATVNVNTYDWATDDRSELIPHYYITKKGSTIFLVDGVNANSTTASVGDELSFYVDPDSGYYGDPVLGFVVDAEDETVEVKGYSQSALTSMVIAAYDKTGAVALTADDNENNTANYSITLGADDTEKFYLRLDNDQANKVYDLKGMCIGWMGNIAEVTPEDSGWTKVAVPEEVDVTVTQWNDSNNSVTGSWKRCYTRDDTLRLEEQDDTGNMQFTVESKGTDPAANQGDFFYFAFFDAGWRKSKDFEVVEDWYTHTDSEETDVIGVNESTLYWLATESLLETPCNGRIAVTIEGL
jgi:hypothetical protein